MKKSISLFLFLVLITVSGYPLYADNNQGLEGNVIEELRTQNDNLKKQLHEKQVEKIQADPDFSIGFGGSYGISDVIKVKGDINWESGYNYSGGFIVEKMYGNHLGLHSGIWYTRTEMDFSLYDNTLMKYVNAVSTWQAVTVPLYFMLSLNASRVSLIFMGGFNLSQNIFSELNSDEPGLDTSTTDVLNYTSYFQFGIAGGINLKFRLGRFFDFFIGGIAELYVLDMLPNQVNSNSLTYPYNYRAVSGFLFRTNLFPIETD